MPVQGGCDVGLVAVAVGDQNADPGAVQPIMAAPFIFTERLNPMGLHYKQHRPSWIGVSY
jgi:hypothetical protein